MRNSELYLQRGPSMMEYARTLSVLTVFSLTVFALAAAVGYLT
jgi:hypothetical protein